jgi:DNA-binding CsgD family transcriptional regulator
VARVERRVAHSSSQGPASFAEAVNQSPERQRILRATYGASEPTVAALTELPRREQEPLRQHLPWPQGDMLALFGSLDDGFGVKLGTAGPSWQVPSARRRVQLLRLSEHLAVGYWLRRQRAGSPTGAPSEVVAVYSPEGRRLDRAPAGADRALDSRLVDAVRGMDRARCRQRKHAPDETTALWQAFVAGRYTLIESFERGGRRVVLAVRCRSPRPALSARETAVALAAARGLPNKLIADELGISANTVGVHLRTALRKLGCPSRRLLSAWLQPKGLPRRR